VGEEAAPMMLTPKVTPIIHKGPSPHAPLANGSRQK
jgi:hypothetical protein